MNSAPLQSYAPPLGSVCEFTRQAALAPYFTPGNNGAWGSDRALVGTFLRVPISPGLQTRKIALYLWAHIMTSQFDSPANFDHSAKGELRFYKNGNLTLALPWFILGANNAELDGASQINIASVTRYWRSVGGSQLSEDDFTGKGFDQFSVQRNAGFGLIGVQGNDEDTPRTVNAFELTGDFDRAEVCLLTVNHGSTFQLGHLEAYLHILSTNGTHRTQYEITG